MCGGGGTPAPPAVADPAAERDKAAQDATASANAKIVADKRRRRAGQNLLADLAGGLDTLGGGAVTTAIGAVLGGGDAGGVASGARSSASTGSIGLLTAGEIGSGGGGGGGAGASRRGGLAVVAE